MQQGTRSRWTKKKKRPENNIAQELNELIVLLHREKHTESIHHIIIATKNERRRKKKFLNSRNDREEGKNILHKNIIELLMMAKELHSVMYILDIM